MTEEVRELTFKRNNEQTDFIFAAFEVRNQENPTEEQLRYVQQQAMEYAVAERALTEYTPKVDNCRELAG